VELPLAAFSFWGSVVAVAGLQREIVLGASTVFGMLDYRAHKLLWLLFLPLRCVGLAGPYLAAVVSPLLVQAFLPRYPLIVKFLVAFLGAEIAISIPFALLIAGVKHLLLKLFFWIVDVVPAHGADEEEARRVVLQGPAYALVRKFERDIGAWTEADTDRFVSLMNWRARWFFPAKERVRFVVGALQRLYRAEGKQPYELGDKVIREIKGQFPGSKEDWFEKLVVNPIAFHTALRLLVVGAVLHYSQ
jgi:hypothetical protein